MTQLAEISTHQAKPRRIPTDHSAQISAVMKAFYADNPRPRVTTTCWQCGMVSILRHLKPIEGLEERFECRSETECAKRIRKREKRGAPTYACMHECGMVATLTHMQPVDGMKDKYECKSEGMCEARIMKRDAQS